MLLSPETLIPSGPPPEAILNRKWMWHLFLMLLGLTFTLRLAGFDVAGALLSGLMLCFAVIMVRDGMQELSKYALIYTVLCGLNLFFDILPLIIELGGRVKQTAHPDGSAVQEDGVRQETYTLTTKVTPFFSLNEGIIYNIQSMSMLLSPLCMAFGMFLSITAHTEIQLQTQAVFDDDLEDFSRVQRAVTTGTVGGLRGQGLGDGDQIADRLSGVGLSRGLSSRAVIERFSGTPYKLT